MRLLILGLLGLHSASTFSQEMPAAPTGEVSVPVASPLAGLIRQDPTEKRIYIGVEDIAAKLEQIVERGGVVDAPRFEAPGVVVLGLFKDPAGNPMALIEMKDGEVIVP